MAALTNTVTTAQVATALDQEMLANFKQEYDRLDEERSCKRVACRKENCRESFSLLAAS